ncbi:MAG: serine hydroxymethyltransferase, partial [Candidatus Firestonebacteria bacterium]|nr:serine hydroxymethyltransferase [Candidatus Firestonebacteria bacterium]
GARYYQDCGPSDAVEQLALDRLKGLFGAEHANVQPHSGSSANLGAYLALLSPGDKILGMDLAAGGHLTHGAKANLSGKLYEAHHYQVDPQTHLIDYPALAVQARQVRPRLIIAGASAYSRVLDFAAFRAICDEVGALLLVDIAHIAGLIVGGVHPNPVPYADIVTSTTHKTLRGPRGGFILCRQAYAKKIDSTIFPGIQGGPLMHVIAAKAVAFHEAGQPDFAVYSRRVVDNAQALAQGLMQRGFKLITGGTDNHLLLMDLRSENMTGAEAAGRMEQAGLVANKNGIPYDPQGPRVTSGVRLGTAALSTRGMQAAEMEQIAGFIEKILRGSDDPARLSVIREEIASLCTRFPVFAQA